VTPLARRLAAESGISLDGVRGSGPSGRIVARDIEAVHAQGVHPAATPSPQHAAETVKALYRDRPFEEVPLNAMRATIAKRVVEAKQTIPHFYLTADVEIGRLLILREEANASAHKNSAGDPAYRLSLNDFVIKAWAA